MSPSAKAQLTTFLSFSLLQQKKRTFSLFIIISDLVARVSDANKTTQSRLAHVDEIIIFPFLSDHCSDCKRQTTMCVRMMSKKRIRDEAKYHQGKIFA